MADSFGMMEGAFFVSRNDLLNWINDLLKISLTKIEQLGTGAVYCQILDACFPGEVPLQKINWKARHEYEFLTNYKILQQAFTKLGIKKRIDVAKLAKVKCQDNLEFGQWMKRFFELKYKEGKKDYNAVERRGNVVPEFAFTQKGASPKSVLIQRNSEGCKKSKEKEAEKRIKISDEESKSVKSSVAGGKENLVPMNLEKVLRERDDLANKLKIIEQIVLSTKESDEALVKKVRDFLGVMNQPEYSPDLDDSFNLMEESEQMREDESLLGNSSSKRDSALLIQGESI